MNLKLKPHGNIATRRYSSDFEAETTLGKIHFHEWLEILEFYFLILISHLFVQQSWEPLQIILNLLNVIQK
jgi:hypothetical protein